MANVLIMGVLIAVMLFPMIHVVCISFSSALETDKGGIFLYPRDFTAASYQAVFSEKNILRSYWNTICYTAAGTFLVLFLSSMIAYTLSIPHFMFKKFITILLTITMFIGGGQIPSYLLMKSLHLLDTFWVMVVPGCVGCYNVILFRTFFQGNAMSLREAAIIDGAGEFRTYLTIVVPLSVAIFATLGLFTAVGKWNSWYEAMIYLTDERKYPYQMILRRILESVTNTMQKTDPILQEMYKESKFNAKNIQMAAIVIGMVPILCVYPFIQKHFVKGVFVGSLKG